MATLEDLNEYKEQLAGVRELLANDPDNEEYKMLEANCLEVIQLTESVLETSIPEEKEKKADLESEPKEAVAVEPAPKPSQSAGGALARSQQVVPSAVPRVPDVPKALEREKKALYARDERCEVRRRKGVASVWYPAAVLSVNVEGNSCNLKFPDAPNKLVENIKFSDMRKLRAVKKVAEVAGLKKGTMAKAFYLEDGLWYNAMVVGTAYEMGGGGAWYYVKFLEYGNTEILPVEYIDASDPTASGDGSEMRRKKRAAVAALSERPVDESVLEVIPPSLELLPSDTPEERESKLKRRKAIKSKNRFLKKDIESNKKQASWQSFQSKISKKRKVASEGGKRKRTGGGWSGPSGGGLMSRLKKKGSLFKRK
jgi:hypothetical protein